MLESTLKKLFLLKDDIIQHLRKLDYNYKEQRK